MVTAAFILGLTGSLHCVGMCGPIALLISGNNRKQYIINRIAYHLGRTVTYMTMGLVMGLMGKIFQFGGWQSYLSLGGGAIIILFLLAPSIHAKIPIFSTLFVKLKSLLGKHLRSGKLYSNVLTGLLNGFLPCGLVYSALLLALVQPSIEYSVLAMALFGLATIPALFIFTGSARLIQQILPISISSLQRITMVVVAVLMIWRGVAFAFPDVVPGSEILCHS
jgi:sulfite exporter TauE/SafE